MKFMEFLEKINPFSKDGEDEKKSDENTDKNTDEVGVSFNATGESDVDSSEGMEKIKQEIERMEFRKNSVLSVFAHEIQQLEQEKSTGLQSIGKHTYESYINQSGQLSCQEELNAVKDLEGKILEKNQQIESFTQRYNEEISILQASVSLQNKKPEIFLLPQTTSKPLVICPHCNEMVQKHRFCFSCGGGLEQEESSKVVVHEEKVVEHAEQEEQSVVSNAVPVAANPVQVEKMSEKSEPTEVEMNHNFGIQIEKPPQVSTTIKPTSNLEETTETPSEPLFLNFSKSPVALAGEEKTGLSPPSS